MSQNFDHIEPISINNNDISTQPNQFNIAVNQVDNQAAFQIYTINNMLKSRPQFVVCPYCHALNNMQGILRR